MGRLTALSRGTVLRVGAVLLTCLWIAAVAGGLIVKPLGVIGLGFALVTALIAGVALLRGGWALMATALLLVAIWSFCNTFGVVMGPHDKLQVYAVLDALLGAAMAALMTKRREPWRIALFLLAVTQLILHTKFAWMWDFSLSTRRNYIFLLNISYAFELVALLVGAVVFDPKRVVDDMPPLPDFVDAGWLECVDSPELRAV